MMFGSAVVVKGDCLQVLFSVFGTGGMTGASFIRGVEI